MQAGRLRANVRGGYLTEEKWNKAEEEYIAVLHARNYDPLEVKAAFDRAFPGNTRSADTLVRARRARPFVRERIRQLQEAPLEAAHPQLRELERQLTVRGQQVIDLQRKLEEADKGADLYQELAEVVRGSAVPLEPVSGNLRLVDRGATPCSMVSLYSDQHADMVATSESTWGLEEYNFDVFRARFQRHIELQAEYLTQHLPRHHFEEHWALILGDGVHGDGHDHKYRNHFKNTMKAALATGDVMAEGFQWLYEQTGVPIRGVGVSGNHPRRTAKKDFDGPHDNFDFLIGTQIATRLRDQEHIDIVLPNSWTAFVEVRGRIWCLNHGDDVKGFAGFPWYGFSRKHNKIQAVVGRRRESVDYFVHGHYHTPAMLAEQNYASWHNGAYPATDPYAVEAVSAAQTPMQWSFVVNDNRGVILPIPIELVDGKRESLLSQGAWTPEFGRRTVLDQVKPATVGLGTLEVIGRTA